MDVWYNAWFPGPSHRCLYNARVIGINKVILFLLENQQKSTAIMKLREVGRDQREQGYCFSGQKNCLPKTREP